MEASQAVGSRFFKDYEGIRVSGCQFEGEEGAGHVEHALVVDLFLC